MGWEGGGGAMSDGVVKKVLLSYAYVAIWIFLSFTVIVYNKYILDPKMYNWPFSISLTMVHMSFYSVLSFLLVRGLRVAEPPTSPPMTPDLYVTSVIPIGTLYAFSLWCCYPHLTLTRTRRSGTRHHGGAVGGGKSIKRMGRRNSLATTRKSDENNGRKRKRKMSGGGGGGE